MSWTTLLKNNRVEAESPTKAELDNLRSIVTRCLQDAAASGLSDEGRFVMAYDAARTLSLMVVRAAGYRPKSKGGHHANTFAGLEVADAAFASRSIYFDGCRTKRNVSEYDYAGGVSQTDADGLLQAARDFEVEVEEWIQTNHPTLAR
jgi:hypothetical protein